MGSYVLRRLLWGVLIVLAVTGLVFLLFYVFPAGDPAALRAGRTASPEQVDEVRQALGLDRPLFVQYGIFLWDLVIHFDLGYSYQYGAPVSELIRERLPITLGLVFGAAVIWLGVGVTFGVRSAARPGSIFDRASAFGSLALLSAPVFWLGYMALILFSLGAGSVLPVLPGIGAYLDAGSLPEKVAALILPCLVLGLSSAAIYVRLTRAVMTEQLG
ncbi:MAG: ABC transporter permease, partial [Actinomycetota bacterium]|nr:ABC transporter permease [Actinomycetota bacterium]